MLTPAVVRVLAAVWMFASTPLAARSAACPSDASPQLVRLRQVAAAQKYEITGVVSTAGCLRVDYVLRPTDESFIRCQLALPVAKRWSGRLWGYGNGGPAGTVGVPLGAAMNGDVAVHTDMGSSRGVFGKREVVRDFGWRATHLMTVSAKELTAAYFARPPAPTFGEIRPAAGRAFTRLCDFPKITMASLPASRRIRASRFTFISPGICA